MRILGLETSSNLVSIAVADERGVLAEIAFRHGMDLSRYLAPRMEEAAEMAGLEVTDLQGVAVSVGPGSFTGLRIGVTTAKTFAFARSLPAAAVGTLEAIAAEHPAPPQTLLCALVSASAADVYAALFQWNGGRLEPRAEEMLLPAAEMAAKLARFPADVLVVGEPGPHRDTLARALGPRLTIAAVDAPPRAGTVAILGRRRILAGEATEAHALAPRYLRPSAAEARRLQGKERAGGAP